MAHYSHYAVQEMLRGLLAADDTLAAKVSGVFDHVPEKTEYPYVTIGDTRGEDESTVGIAITRITVNVQVYSRAKGRKEADGILADVHRLLHDAALSDAVGGFVLAGIRYAGSEITLLRDGMTYQGRMRFTARLQTVGA